MAQKVPPPVYNSLGDRVGSWSVRIDYDEAADTILVFARKPGTRWLKEKRWTQVFTPDQVEEALEVATRIVRSCGARRLF